MKCGFGLLIGLGLFLSVSSAAAGSRPSVLWVVGPRQRKGPAPVFLGLNYAGNHALIADPGVDLPGAWMRDGPGVENNRATERGRGTQARTWAIEQSIDRGYAVAT